MPFSSMPRAGTCASAGAGDNTSRSSEMHATKVSVSHVHTISGYSHTKRCVAPGEYVISSNFTAAGHRWCIPYYPRGYCNKDADCISLFVSCKDTEVKARAKLCLLDKDGKLAYTCRCRTYVLPTCSLQGLKRFITRKDLKTSGHVRDDCLRTRFDITVLKLVVPEEDAVVDTVPKFVDVPPSDIFQRLGDLLSSGEGADVMFEVDGESFGTHRSILAARSPVFRAEMFIPMKEGTKTCVWVEDMETRVFKAMLHFVYNDVLPEMDERETFVMAKRLLVAADRYCLERLKLICENKLCCYIDTDTVGTILALADQHGCRGLQRACLNFLKSRGNLLAALLTGGLEPVLSSCPSVKELLLKCCT